MQLLLFIHRRPFTHPTTYPPGPFPNSVLIAKPIHPPTQRNRLTHPSIY